jgi:hypothetical protein
MICVDRFLRAAGCFRLAAFACFLMANLWVETTYSTSCRWPKNHTFEFSTKLARGLCAGRASAVWAPRGVSEADAFACQRCASRLREPNLLSDRRKWHS